MSLQPTLLDQARELVANGSTQDAVDLMLGAARASGHPATNELIMLRARAVSVGETDRRGLATPDATRAAHQQIGFALLALLDEIERAGQREHPRERKQASMPKAVQAVAALPWPGPAGDSAVDLTGRVISSCRVDQRLGTGGMGVVYRAHHLVLDKPVALKVLHPHLAAIEIYVDRFLREARSAARLGHPNAAQILHAGEEGGILHIVMELVEGEDLATRLRRDGRIPVSTALTLARDVAGVLAAAHGLGLIHRDIKPANVLLTTGDRAKVVDFGIARAFLEAGSITQSGEFVGSPCYMSPEQFTSTGVDGRADLYSLGVLLYEIISGAPPFSDNGGLGVMVKHLTQDPPELSTEIGGVTDRVSALVRKLLAKQPDDRFQSATEVIDELDRIGSSTALTAR